MISLSSHVLDTARGVPADNMNITLITPDGKEYQATTNDDGRCKDWGIEDFTPGVYHIRFHCKEYLLRHVDSTLYPFVDIHFEMTADGGHYHIPLLISPFGFSSYRGS
ncbi:hypothetical protein TRIADDRAFT_35134 [Trichoplax adhaerens]|uniref:5-hydroxyisourate hydrolase n=1 Tax=Trichoplax adhaerens TaxID=10228 RepID=B3SFS1_TRIAD|nr:hypothetical protein TRIADDRAFT_35134 [Trichoplax adhaerens]EDV18424.1 hypothetical protein TRIADDRAFT_35134 [Trichoplax adhaerens]|eukprot:XP_002119090.1 hypothetical protein TRIADDRAFT_35134 [Trichoplax adhaerens]